MANQLEQIDQARDLVSTLLHGRLNDTARAHLNRALNHIAEAWLAEDGQSARSVEAVARNNASLQRLTSESLTNRIGHD